MKYYVQISTYLLNIIHYTQHYKIQTFNFNLFFGASARCIQHLWWQALGQRGEAEEGQGEAQAGAGHRQIYLQLLIMIHRTPESERVSRMQLGQASVNPPDFLKL